MKSKLALLIGMVGLLTLGSAQLAFSRPGTATCSLSACFNNPAAVNTCHQLVAAGFCPAVGGPACCYV